MIRRQDVPDDAVFAMQDCMRHPDTSPWDWIVAAINAWPGAAERRSWDGSVGRLILPLTENTND